MLIFFAKSTKAPYIFSAEDGIDLVYNRFENLTSWLLTTKLFLCQGIQNYSKKLIYIFWFL